MTSKQIKDFLAKQFGIKARVRTGVSKNPFICAWQPDEQGDDRKIGHQLVYTQPPFPLEFRQKCLGAIYGANDSLAKSTNDSVGNVSIRMISMHAKEWEQVMALYGWLREA